MPDHGGYLMIIIYIILTVAMSFTCLFSVYLLLLTLAAWRFKKDARVADRQPAIAVLVPAHDEALQIEATVKAILACDYPAELKSLFVIADNCTDETARVAREAGAVVVERTNTEQRGKGQALDWFFHEHQQRYVSCDLVAIVDADSLPDRDFLKEMAVSFGNPGIMAVQGFYGVSNPRDSWRTLLSAAALAVFNHVRPAGQERLGASVSLKGNGLAMRSEIFQRYGWPAHSKVEDLEFYLMLLKDGIRVHYNPDAVVFGEMAASGSQSSVQRRRWEGGRLAMLKQHGMALLKRCLQTQELPYLDAFMELAIPPLSLLVCVQTLLLLVAWSWFSELIAIAAACLLISIFYVVSGLLLKRMPLAVWLGLLSAPLFVLWKLALYLKMILFPEGDGWHRTQRKAELSSSDPAAGEKAAAASQESPLNVRDPKLLQELYQRYAIGSSRGGRLRGTLYYWFKKYLWLLVTRSTLVLKRLLDIVVSGLMLVLLSPLFLATAIAIKLEDPGPVTYSQTRISKWGRPFTMYKFRSMVVNADKIREELLAKEASGDVRFKMKRDPRITRVGYFIRKFSIDELPQLWNVFRGDMSLVGPRPPIPEEVAKYSLAERRRLEVIPGITCIWQVSGRSDIDFEGQVRLDVQYIENQSFLGDIKLLLKTIPAVLLGKGAY
jgi:lipopolysaccharide/colanic/teichoic acid biosynthesis glycosyltransferase/cellulose synthase/poly-beta-1,6-N-acetylglucosamine synthase-like glycosyltransferase